MAEHDSQPYRDLFNDFREGWAEFGKLPLRLEGWTDAERYELPEEVKACHLSRLGFVSWFIERGFLVVEEGFWVWASVGVQGLAADGRIRTACCEAVKILAQLSARAGARLPSEIRREIPGEPIDPDSIWYSVLWILHPLNQESHFEHDSWDHALSLSPFEDSINALEHLGLCDDDEATAPNGPVPPNAFYWDDELRQGLKPVPFRLIDTLWKSNFRRRETRTLGEAVWGDHNYEPSNDGQDVISAVKAINKFLKGHQIPFQIAKKDGWLLLND